MDAYGISNFSSGAGLYNSLAGGAVPPATTYATAAANSSNGVNWSGIASGVSSLATSGANIYATIANAGRKPSETNITLLDPRTGLPQAVTPDGGRPAAAGNNNLLFIIAGVVIVAVIGFVAFFKKRK